MKRIHSLPPVELPTPRASVTIETELSQADIQRVADAILDRLPLAPVIAPPDAVFDTAAAAAFLGVSDRQLWEFVKQGRLPVVKFDRNNHYLCSTLLAFAARHEERQPGAVDDRRAA